MRKAGPHADEIRHAKLHLQPEGGPPERQDEEVVRSHDPSAGCATRGSLTIGPAITGPRGRTPTTAASEVDTGRTGSALNSGRGVRVGSRRLGLLWSTPRFQGGRRHDGVPRPRLVSDRVERQSLAEDLERCATRGKGMISAGEEVPLNHAWKRAVRRTVSPRSEGPQDPDRRGWAFRELFHRRSLR
jgi:hypothetical protein